MKIISFCGLAFLIILSKALTGCDTGRTIAGSWQEKPIIADANSNDWGEHIQYDQDSRFFYKISNDQQQLYIMLRIDDQSIQTKILTCGLTIWIDTTGHKKETLGIHYPQGREKTFAPEMQKRSQPNKNSQNQLKNDLIDNIQTIEFIGFNGRSSDVMLIGEARIMPVINFDSNNSLIYECILPLKYINSKPGWLPKKPISFCFATGNMERPVNAANMGGRPEESLGGGMHGGGMRGGGMESNMGGDLGARPGRMRANMETLSQTSKLWVKGYNFKNGQ